MDDVAPLDGLCRLNHCAGPKDNPACGSRTSTRAAGPFQLQAQVRMLHERLGHDRGRRPRTLGASRGPADRPAHVGLLDGVVERQVSVGRLNG